MGTEHEYVNFSNGIYTSPVDADYREIPKISITSYLFSKLHENNLHETDKPWVIDARTGVQVLFKDIESKSRAIASGLARAGFAKGDTLYFVTYETAQLYLVQMAVWRLGGAVRGCYQQENQDEYARQLKETRSKFILVDPETESILKSAIDLLDWPVKLLSFGQVDGAVSVQNLLEDDGTAFPEDVAFDSDDVIVIPNTSGSTGLPKGVLHTHATFLGLSYNRNTMTAALDFTFMTPMSNYAVGSYMLTMNTIVHGATIIHLGKFVREEYISNMIKYKPGNCLMYPFVASWFARCEDLEKVDLSFLKMISSGGSVLDPTTAELLAKRLPHIRLAQFYGMTECLGIANSEIMRDEEEAKVPLVTMENEGELCVSSGKLVPYVEAKIVDEKTGALLGPNNRGLVFLRSPMIMKGYITHIDAKPLRKDIDEDGWLKTGDIGFFDQKGNIYVVERESFMFKYFMFIVSPTEIESVIQEHPDVHEVGVVGVPHLESTSVARAFVVLKPGRQCTEESICQFVATKLPTYKQLHGGVQFMDSLPESRGNKLDRPALKKMAMNEKMSFKDGIYSSPVKANFHKLPKISIFDYLISRLVDNELQDSEIPWVIDARKNITVRFKDIESGSKAIASGLTRMGFVRGDTLLFVTYETAQLYLVQLAVWRLGGAVRGSYQKEKPDEYARQLRETRTRFVLVDPETESNLKSAVKLVNWPIKIIAFGGVEDAMSVKDLLEDDGSALPENVGFDSDDIVAVINTSGSTGLPKGVFHTHATFIGISYSHCAIKATQASSLMTSMANFGVGSFLFALQAVVYGLTLIHVGKFRREDYLDYMLLYKPRSCYMFPFVAAWLARCDKLSELDLSFLKSITVGGSVLDPATVQLITTRLPQVGMVQVYGMTECLGLASSAICREHENNKTPFASLENEGKVYMAAGKLAPYVEAKILDRTTGAMLGPEHRGLVYVRSPMIMKGYSSEHHDGKPDRSEIDENGWLKTGDIGFFDIKGNIYIVERENFLFKYYMFIVSPTEIESVIQKHPDVHQVGVVGVPHIESTNVARAFVVLKPGRQCTEENICQFVAERLPSFKHLHGGVQFVDTLPQSRGFKLDKIALKNMAMQN